MVSINLGSYVNSVIGLLAKSHYFLLAIEYNEREFITETAKRN